MALSTQIAWLGCTNSNNELSDSQLPLFAFRYGDQIGTLIGIANNVPEMVLVEEADNSNEV